MEWMVAQSTYLVQKISQQIDAYLVPMRMSLTPVVRTNAADKPSSDREPFIADTCKPSKKLWSDRLFRPNPPEKLGDCPRVFYEGFLTFSKLRPVFHQGRFSTTQAVLQPPYGKVAKFVTDWLFWLRD